jgi:protein gp37
MGKTSIEWTDASWNPIVGCTEVSPGCANCYAARLAATRLSGVPAYKDLAILNNGKPRWLGNVAFLAERLEEPLHWRKPRRIFVCDMGDLFHESVQMEWLWQIWSVIAACPRHTFQILTKRADRMHFYVKYFANELTKHCIGELNTPLPNVWLGVSVENQRFADERIPLLLQTPAAVRFLSCEPLLGKVDLYKLRHATRKNILVDWVIAGGESGPHARPMHPDWARSLRDQCQAAGVPFFFKQWGEWWSGMRLGKKKAGRLLDGREWNEFPAPTS